MTASHRRGPLWLAGCWLLAQAVIERIGDGCYATSTPLHVCELDVRVQRGFPPPDPRCVPGHCRRNHP
eukprot:COSAG01_NODE_13773_length_1537_cov_2.423505_1_plen_67_part_10